MAFSSITIEFTTVPKIGDILSFSEQKLGLTFIETFKESRINSFDSELPEYSLELSRYIGYVPKNYRVSFDLDYNGSSKFITDHYSDPTGNALGTVTITATYADAVFVINTKKAGVVITIDNVSTSVVPPVVISTFSPANVDFVHNQNQALESKIISLNMPNFKVVGKPNFRLSSSLGSVTINNISSALGNYQIAAGTGIANVIITPTTFFDTDGPTASDLAGSFSVLSNDALVGTIAFTVTVNKLLDFLTLPTSFGQKSFTLDPLFFKLSTQIENTYFQFNTTVNIYDFFTNTLKEILIPQKMVPFKGKTKVNLGQVIHRLMNRFETVNDSLLQYQEASIDIEVIEKSLVDHAVIRSASALDLPFVAGVSNGIKNFGFLDINLKPNRVTVNGFAYLNILIPAGSYELRTFKNGMLIKSESLPAYSSKLLSKKIYFSIFRPGDQIDFTIDVVGQKNKTAPIKSFVVFPEGKHTNMIVWENEFLLQSAIECTGNGTFVSDGDFISQTIYNNLIEQLDHLSSSKTVKLNVNTGWLAHSDIDTVESLMRSKRAWLIQENKTIKLRPIGKKLPEKDLDTELIQFSLEFQINQTYNEETYSF